MQSVIKMQLDSTGITEMVMLEFQGDFQHNQCENNFEGLELGTMIEKAKGQYELVVGNHLLQGKLAVLQRPIVMSERVTTGDGRINIQIQGVIRNKIQFSTRPTPIRQQSQKVVPQTSASQTGADLLFKKR